MALTLLPTAPDITDPDTFEARAQAFVLALATLVSELNAIIGLTIPAGSAAAGTLTGGTLAANVLASSLTSLGTALIVGANDVVTVPLQPSFAAYLGASSDNRTGNGTPYGPVIFGTELFDRGSNYNNAAGVFTAPVTGTYSFSARLYLTGAAALANATMTLSTSNSAWPLDRVDRVGSALDMILNGTAVAVDMDAGDTASIEVVGNGEAGNTVDIFGAGGNLASWFSGRLAG